METSNLIQEEIIRAVVNARNEGKDIKKTIKTLAKEFSLTEFVVRGIIEWSATYGLEQVTGPKAMGKKWVPLNHVKAIKRLEDKIYELQGAIVKLGNTINRDGIGRHNPRILSDRIREDREDDGTKVPTGDEHKPIEEIERVRAKIDKVRDRIDKRGE